MRSPRSFLLRLIASLVVDVLTVSALAGPYADAEAALDSTSDRAAIERIVAKVGLANDPAVARWRAAKSDEDRFEALDGLHEIVAARAVAERADTTPVDSSKVVEIKRDPFFKDAGVGHGESAFSRWLSNLLKKLFERKPQQLSRPDVGFLGSISEFIVWFVWLVVAAVVIGILVFALKQFSWKKRLRRKATTVLEDDEPERSRDEWLASAEELAAKGRYREAIRALYVACLLQFDENRVARFDRGQTNWEHVDRILKSPRRPISIDFEATTRRFDLVWYGFAPCGPSDVADFRQTYEAIKASSIEEAA